MNKGIRKNGRVGKCCMCGMSMRIRRIDCDTCSSECRKAKSRHNQKLAKEGVRMIRINGVNYPAHVLEMFTPEEIEEHTK